MYTIELFSHLLSVESRAVFSIILTVHGYYSFGLRILPQEEQFLFDHTYFQWTGFVETGSCGLEVFAVNLYQIKMILEKS